MTATLPPRPGPRHALPEPARGPRPCPARPPVGSLRAPAPAIPLPARRRSWRGRTVALLGAGILALGLTGTVVVARSSPAVADDLARLDVPIPFVTTGAPPTTPATTPAAAP